MTPVVASRTEPSPSVALADEAQFLAEVEPIVVATIRRRLAVSLRADDQSAANQDALEMANDARAAVLVWRRSAGKDVDPAVVPGYVAATTRNACAEHFRRRATGWVHLKNRLRYLLRHDDRFALWRGRHDTLVCGWSAWKDRDASDPPADALMAHSTTASLLVLVPAVFMRAGAPLELDALVEIIAEHLQVARGLVSLDAPTGARARDAAATTTPVSDTVEQRSMLTRLWTEVMDLPVRQRVALLCNLRDEKGGDVLGLLAVTGVARLEVIAAVLGLRPELLVRLLPRLPLPDAEIARWLSVERQQVVNLRKAARARLLRRLGAVFIEVQP